MYHTWTEYINRLSSVLSGFVFVFLIGILIFQKIFKKQSFVKGTGVLVFLAFLGMGFEAWLGKVVVDSFLSPYVITFHMIGGLLIIGLLLRTQFLVEQAIQPIKFMATNQIQKLFKTLLMISLLMMVVQILLGTQVRQFVDTQVKLFGFEHKEFRLLNPSLKFYIHRSYTILIVLINAFLFWLNIKYKLGFKNMKWVMALLLFEAVTGILMYYVNFPFGTQAIHLLSGALLYGILLYLFFKTTISTKNSISQLI